LTIGLTGTRYRSAVETVLVRRRRQVVRSHHIVEAAVAAGAAQAAAAAVSLRATGDSETAPADTLKATSMPSEVSRTAQGESRGPRVNDNVAELATVKPICHRSRHQRAP